MPLVYAALDLQVTSAWGEGFGLTTLEGMACGVPQIAPRHTALADWAARGAYMLSAGEQIITTGGQNLAGFVTSPAQLAHTMWTLLRDASLRQQVARAGFSLAHEPQFRWYACAEGIHAVLAAGVRDGVTA
jgi:glycosyltransferase involved in cell wall biosynthesis